MKLRAGSLFLAALHHRRQHDTTTSHHSPCIVVEAVSQVPALAIAGRRARMLVRELPEGLVPACSAGVLERAPGELAAGRRLGEATRPGATGPPACSAARRPARMPAGP